MLRVKFEYLQEKKKLSEKYKKITNAQGQPATNYAKAIVETESLIKIYLQAISNEFN